MWITARIAASQGSHKSQGKLQLHDSLRCYGWRDKPIFSLSGRPPRPLTGQAKTTTLPRACHSSGADNEATTTPPQKFPRQSSRGSPPGRLPTGRSGYRLARRRHRRTFTDVPGHAGPGEPNGSRGHHLGRARSVDCPHSSRPTAGGCAAARHVRSRPGGDLGK